MIRFPPRNLPGSAGNWGRAVEKVLSAVDKRVAKLESSLTNSLRATGGQITGLAKQIQELTLGRKSFFSSANDVTFTHSAINGQKPGPTIPLTFPGPRGGGRSAILAFSYNASSSNSATSTNIWFELLLNGEVVWRSPSSIQTSGPSRPNNWSEAVVSSFASVAVPAGATADFALRAWFYDFQSASHVITFKGISGTLTYGDLI